MLNDYVPLALAINTEKARSEFIIAPVLAEVRRLMHYQVSLFSGVELVVEPEEGLTGPCDFVLSCSARQFVLTAPVLLVVEAKCDDINSGLGQCVAAVVAAQRFNERQGNPTTPIHGCVTTGNLWKFLELAGKVVAFGQGEYHIGQAGKIVAVLLSILKRHQGGDGDTGGA
ncbi:MAG: hypothetical protein HC884_15410 [Chloroflexaceae bacterium]|nr:hypothetical protein [Chloroflexaceae bacterium]